MRYFISSIPAALLLFALLASRSAAVEYTSDDFAKVQRNLSEKKAVLIDVREVGEWKQGHLKQASLVPLSQIRLMKKDPAVRAKLDPSLPKDRIIYCHCASGVRVISAAQLLGPLGYDIRPLKASYRDLVSGGFPVAPEK